ncbi:MAG: IS3 family transposase [candidate division WOR-3 bacterium]
MAVDTLKQSGYTISAACQSLGFTRSSYYQRKATHPLEKRIDKLQDLLLIEKIKTIKLEHPYWGYRRIRAWLRYRDGILVNEKKVRRLMKAQGLMVKQTIHKAKQTPKKSKPRAERPKQYWDIDMTKFIINGLGWVYLVIVLDWYTKKVVGWDISLRSKSSDWQRALSMAVNREFSDGVRGKGLKLISDNGSQPTSVSFMKETANLEIEQIFTSYDNPKGNADTERMMRTIKEEVIWLNEFETLAQAKEKLSDWFENSYNKFYVHSSIAYMSPVEFEASYNRSNVKKTV